MILQLRCDVISDVVIVKYVFPSIIVMWSFHICVDYFHIFQNDEVWGPGIFFADMVTGSLLCQTYIQAHLIYLRLLIETLAQILTELWDFPILTFFFRSMLSHQHHK